MAGAEAMPAAGVVLESSGDTFWETRDRDEGYGTEGVAFSTTILADVKGEKERLEDVRVYDSLKDPM